MGQWLAESDGCDGSDSDVVVEGGKLIPVGGCAVNGIA